MGHRKDRITHRAVTRQHRKTDKAKIEQAGRALTMDGIDLYPREMSRTATSHTKKIWLRCHISEEEDAIIEEMKTAQAAAWNRHTQGGLEAASQQELLRHALVSHAGRLGLKVKMVHGRIVRA